MQSTFPNSFFYYTAFEAQKILQTFTDIQVEWLETIHSTNDYLKDKIKQNSLDFNKNSFVTLTWEQTKGRGQYDRNWLSQKKQCLMMSFAMQLPINSNRNNSPNNNLIPSGLSLVSGLSVCSAFSQILYLPDNQKNLFLKWPNDLIFQDKKLGGLLVEIISSGNTHFLIIGLGLNLYLNHKIQNDAKLSNAIGLDDLISNIQEQNIFKFIADILHFWQENVKECCEFGFEHFLSEWENFVYKPNKMQLFSLNPHTKISGYYDHIDSKGNLYIKNKYGNVFKL
ncbi:MAG: bifunctional biotin biosynthesis protein BirA [Pseudomonadota bacterium]|jgi:BirA family biotin operon repressor/biotin-[acetyl-CoA-carboxylase] ligase